MATHEVTFPITDEQEILKLRAGDEVIVQGHIIGLRDRTQIRICVRSRMPMMWPWTTTSSPARSLRISASSVIGKVTSWVAIRPLCRSRRSRRRRCGLRRAARPSTGS